MFERRNEFVLTTAVGRGSDEVFFEFVKEISEAGTSALSIAMGRRRAVRAAANNQCVGRCTAIPYYRNPRGRSVYRYSCYFDG